MACLGKDLLERCTNDVQISDVSVLGMWGAGESIKAVFALSGAATSFGCKSPV